VWTSFLWIWVKCVWFVAKIRRMRESRCGD
jgi:hypothetical protein